MARPAGVTLHSQDVVEVSLLSDEPPPPLLFDALRSPEGRLLVEAPATPQSVPRGQPPPRLPAPPSSASPPTDPTDGSMRQAGSDRGGPRRPNPRMRQAADGALLPSPPSMQLPAPPPPSGGSRRGVKDKEDSSDEEEEASSSSAFQSPSRDGSGRRKSVGDLALNFDEQSPGACVRNSASSKKKLPMRPAPPKRRNPGVKTMAQRRALFESQIDEAANDNDDGRVPPPKSAPPGPPPQLAGSDEESSVDSDINDI